MAEPMAALPGRSLTVPRARVQARAQVSKNEHTCPTTSTRVQERAHVSKNEHTCPRTSTDKCLQQPQGAYAAARDLLNEQSGKRTVKCRGPVVIAVAASLFCALPANLGVF